MCVSVLLNNYFKTNSHDNGDNHDYNFYLSQ